MKISKVDHIRAGVKLENNGSGILYRNTDSSNSEKAIENHIKKSISNAAKLYNILTQKPDYKLSDKLLEKYGLKDNNNFNNKKIKKEKEKIANKIANNLSRNFNVLFKNCIKDKSTYAAIENLKNYTGIKSVFEPGADSELIDEVIEFLTNFRIRKSMTRVVKSDNKTEVDMVKVINTILRACVDKRKYKEFTERLCDAKFKKETEIFIEYANKDCNKKELSKKIQKSIENQNVRIQVDDDKLVPASYFTESKRWVFEWIKEYACSDRNK